MFISGIEVKFINEFGSEANLPYDGGKMEIICKLTQPCAQGDTIRLQYPKHAKNESKVRNGDSAKFEVPINKATIFGEYKCESSFLLNFRYRFCKYF